MLKRVFFAVDASLLFWRRDRELSEVQCSAAACKHIQIQLSVGHHSQQETPQASHTR